MAPKKGRSSTSAQARQTTACKWSCQDLNSPQCVTELPQRAIEAILNSLDVVDMPSARSVCKLFAEHSGKGITEFGAFVEHDADRALMKLFHITKLLPQLQHLKLRFSNRVKQDNFSEYLRQLSMLLRLNSLTLECCGPADPKMSSLITSFTALGALKMLKEIILLGCVFPKENCLAAMATLPNLTKFVFKSPADKEELLCFSAETSQVEQLASLEQLEHLEFRAQADICLTALVALTKLTYLAIRGDAGCDSTELGLLAKLPLLQQIFVPIEDDADLGQAMGLHSAPSLQVCRLRLHNREILPDSDFLCCKLQGKLTELDLAICTLSTKVVSCLASLTELESLSLNNPSVEFGSDSTDLTPWTTLMRLTSFCLINPSGPRVIMLHLALPRLLAAWQGLRRLHLHDVGSEELQGSCLASVQDLAQLEELEVLGSDTTPLYIEMHWQWLPAKLRKLQLRNCHMRPKYLPQRRSGRGSRMPQPCEGSWAPDTLQEITLARCKLDQLDQTMVMVAGMTQLQQLELEDIDRLCDAHMAQLGRLTRLTELSVMGLGNPHLTNSGLVHLAGLQGLLKLKWHAGDILDFIIDPTALKAFPRLMCLSITNSMFWRMSRWSALNVLDLLPNCEVECSGL